MPVPILETPSGSELPPGKVLQAHYIDRESGKAEYLMIRRACRLSEAEPLVGHGVHTVGTAHAGRYRAAGRIVAH
jgi:hypothetical protein